MSTRRRILKLERLMPGNKRIVLIEKFDEMDTDEACKILGITDLTNRDLLIVLRSFTREKGLPRLISARD